MNHHDDDEHFVAGGRDADPEAVARELVSALHAQQQRARRIEGETGAPPEPGGYVRFQIWRRCAHEERDRLLASGVTGEEAVRRAVVVADADRDARLRERALGRLAKVDCLTRQAQDVAGRVRTLIGTDADTDQVLAALDEAIGLHERIVRILKVNRAAFDGSAYRRPAG